MMKSLFAGATALALIAGAAVAQQAYDSTTSRTTTTVTAPVQVVPTVPAQTSTTTVERTVAPPVVVAAPAGTSSYHEEHVRTEDGQTVEKSVKTETSSPYGTRSSTYSQTTTRSDGE